MWASGAGGRQVTLLAPLGRALPGRLPVEHGGLARSRLQLSLGPAWILPRPPLGTNAPRLRRRGAQEGELRSEDAPASSRDLLGTSH